MSFDKLETAQRARDIIARQATTVIEQQVPRPLVGRMVTVDPARLKGMVWFPGDEQPVEVNFFNNTLPASWQEKDKANSDLPQTSTQGHGSEVVVERLNGALYVTDVLTGGAFGFRVSQMGSTTINQQPTVGITDAPWDEIPTSVGGYNQSVVSVFVGYTTAPGQNDSVVFGPFTRNDKSDGILPAHMEVIISSGMSFDRGTKTYKFVFSPERMTDADGDNNHWWRVLPDHNHDYSGSIDDDWDFDIKLVDTSWTVDTGGAQYVGLWMRITQNLGATVGSTANYYAVTVKTSAFNKAGGFDLDQSFTQSQQQDSPPAVGYIGFHGSNTGIEILSNNTVFDTFYRTEIPTATAWGFTQNGLGSSNLLAWNGLPAGSGIELDPDTTPHSSYTHWHAYMGIDAVGGQRTSWLDQGNSYLDLDLYYEFALEHMPLTQTTRVGWRLRSDQAGSVNELNMGAQIEPDGDVFIRFVKAVGGVFTDVGANFLAMTGFTTSDNVCLRVQIRGNTMRAKAWDRTDPQPQEWQKTETIADAVNQDAGKLGIWGMITSGSTTPVPTKIYFHNVKAQLQRPNRETSVEKWTTGPWRSGVLRAGQDIQRTLNCDGEFTFDGPNQRLKWTGTIWASGIGSNRDILKAGRSGIQCPTSGDIPISPNISLGGDYYAATSAGIFLPEWFSLYLAIPPGVDAGVDALEDYLFYVWNEFDSSDYNLPEWAVLIASRGSADMPIRLGNGELLKPSCKVWRSTAFTFVANTWLLMSWNSEEWNDYGMHSIGTNPSRILIPCDGIYEIEAAIAIVGNGSTTTRAAQVRKNSGGAVGGGTGLIQVNVAATSSGTQHTTVPISLRTKLVAGDYLEIFGYSIVALDGLHGQTFTQASVAMA